MCKQPQSISVHFDWRMPVQIAVIKTPRPANIAMIDSGGIVALFYFWGRILSLKNH